jgi:endoglucanase
VQKNWTVWVAVLVAMGCGGEVGEVDMEGQPGLISAATSASALSGNPFAGVKFFVDPNSSARRQANTWRSSRPADAQQMEKLAQSPQANWMGEWSGDIQAAARSRVDQVTAAGALPVFVAYNIPARDCGSHSAGGANSPAAYRTWIRNFKAGIADRQAVVILEPDALAGADCLSAADQKTRFDLLKDAVTVLQQGGKVAVYIDAGHSKWLSTSDAAARLKSAGIEQARGFSLNVSNYNTTAAEVAYGKSLSGLVGNKPFVVDTSRNGKGPNGEWCNPSGRALGPKPTASTGENLVDAYFWVKAPGESDGTCNGGPSAGTWWPDYALGLAKRAAY